MPLGQLLFVNLVVDGKVERRQIRLGQRQRGKAEVIEGLDGSETLISAGWQKVAPGREVRSVARGEAQ